MKLPLKAKFLLTILVPFVVVASTMAEESRVAAKGYALFAKDGRFRPYEFDRHAVGDNDVLIEILYAGICHSDIHHAREDWRDERYPMVPGHEIAGRVVQVGKDVTKFHVGDYAGVGCLQARRASCRGTSQP